MIIQTFGKSMHPYLQDQDMVLAEPLGQSPRPGELVLLKDETTGETIAHRFVLNPRFGLTTKGDQAKYFDPETNSNLKTTSLITARLVNGKAVPLTTPVHQFGFKVMAAISARNSYLYPVQHRVAEIFVRGIGRALRWYDNWWASRKWKTL